MEREKLYREIALNLQKAFPEGTVQKKEQEYHAHIPVQAYIRRLEDEAGIYWSWEILGEPVIYPNENKVMIKGRLTIVDASRTGIGFSSFKTHHDTGKIQGLKAVFNAAESDAIRNACDKFLMGWKDLAPYRKWAMNPGSGLIQYIEDDEHPVEKRNCTRCNSILTPSDESFLKQSNIRLPFCKEHIPLHFLKKD